MKKLLCVVMAIALACTTLSGCARRRRANESADAPTSATEGNFAPDVGPGYTITDGSTGLSAEGIGDDQPTPEPIETLPPEDIELEKRRASMTSETEGEAIPEDMPDADPAGMSESGIAAEDADDVVLNVGVPISGQDDVVLGTYDEATDTAQHAAPSVIDTSAYQFNAVVDDNLDFTFNYPAHWNNVPGIYTVCYREPVDDGDYPARIAVTRKRLVHTPDDAALMEQMSSYMRSVANQYDKATFQTSTPNYQDSFMGTRAFSNTYLAYWGDIEIKGFVIGCAIERTLYVLHFSASYGDYLALQNVLKYMLQSVHQKT